MRLQRLARHVACGAFGVFTFSCAFADVSVIDDTNRTVTLKSPARRIVSLAPHATELLFAAGAGPYVVGVSEYSDYPPEAKRIPSVGSSVSLDLERIVQLKPDLVVGWNSGNVALQMSRLETLNIPLYRSEAHDFTDIATSIERLAHLSGTDAIGKEAADHFRGKLKRLQTTYQQRPTVTVFYQIWRNPLMTLNGDHTVSKALRLCGAENAFSGLQQIAPTVDVEAVVKADPEAIIASSGSKDDAFATWRKFPKLKAVARGNLLQIDGNLLNRSGPRILDGTESLCRQLEVVRSKR